MPDIRDMLEVVNELAPPHLVEEWDNVGLMVGRKSMEFDKVVLALDPTRKNIRLAAERHAKLLLTHHPLIFRPMKKVDLDDPVGAALALAIQLDVAVISAHTNLDAARGGVNRALGEPARIEKSGPFGRREELECL